MSRCCGGNLDYGSFDRQLQRHKCRSNGLHVILCTQLHDEFFMHLAASAWCMVLFSAKGVHVRVLYALTALFPSVCTLQRQRIAGASTFPLIFLQKAAMCTTVANYLFNFDSQGPITVRSLTASSPWMSVGSCFSNCLDVFLAFSSIYSKFYL